MSDRQHIGLDNPAFRGRLRQPSGLAQSLHMPASSARQAANSGGRPSARYLSDFTVHSRKTSSALHAQAKPQQQVKPQLAAQAITPQRVLPPIPAPLPPSSPQRLSPTQAANLRRPAPAKPALKPARQAVPTVAPAVHHRQEQSQVLKRPDLFATNVAVAAEVAAPKGEAKKKSRIRRIVAPLNLRQYSKMQLAMMAMGTFIFITGLSVSAMTLRTNHNAAAQVAALAKSTENAPATTDAAAAVSPGTGNTGGATTAPSTVRPSTHVVSSYAVGPTMPRYLDIPKLGVHARVLSLGILNNGALATPNNVFDVGWYNESSLPGQPGVTLIDGHVSSWTAHGVFYGIKTLAAGDQIQIERGDGQVITYQVVSHQIYDHNNMDMHTALQPVDPTTTGLNLITCTGDVIPGTSEFNERILVQAKQV